MMIQPGMSLALANECGATRASSPTCEACHCCEVPALNERCGCCAIGEPEASDRDCCVGEKESQDPWNSLDVAAADVVVRSRCGCGVESPPLGDSAPARPSIPTREFVAIRHSDLADLFGSPILPPRPSSVRDEDPLRPPNFSQIQLGIWRL